MSKFFYRDIKIIKLCKVCKVAYRPRKGSFAANSGLCWKCRRPYIRELGLKKKQWLAKQSPEVRARYKQMAYAVWRKWVIKNIDRRRKQALESYHRKKNEPRNKARRHRATKKV